MRFLIVTMPVSGHVGPALPISKKLVERGHEVRWYTSARFQDRIESTGARFVPFRVARDLDYDRTNELFPERARLKGLSQAKWDLKKLVIDLAVEQCEDVAGILRQFSADVVLGDTFAFSAQLVAEQMGFPLALLNITNLYIPSQDTAPDGLGIAPSVTPFGRVRNRLLNWLVFRVLLGDVNRHFNKARAELGLSPVRETLFEVAALHSQLFLQPSITAFEYPRSDLPDHVRFIGSLLPPAPADFTPPPWWEELRSERPVVLVTQGTLATDPEQLLVPSIRGLAGEDILIVATSGNELGNHERLAPLPGNVRLERFVPFARLMPHVDVMVTNGGYGGIHFALADGVPLVAGGQSEDKAETCARIAWSGVGINLKSASPTPEKIASAVRTVLGDPRYRQNATAMQSELARHDAATEASELLESLSHT